MKKLFSMLEGLLVLVLLFSSSIIYSAEDTIPKTINIQGKLTTDSGQSLSGKSYSMRFNIYEQGNPTPIFYKDETGNLDDNGLYSKDIDISSFNQNFSKIYSYDVSITVDGKKITSTKTNFASSPYAFYASTSTYTLKLDPDNGDKLVNKNFNQSTSTWTAANTYNIAVGSATYAVNSTTSTYAQQLATHGSQNYVWATLDAYGSQGWKPSGSIAVDTATWTYNLIPISAGGTALKNDNFNTVTSNPTYKYDIKVGTANYLSVDGTKLVNGNFKGYTGADSTIYKIKVDSASFSDNALAVSTATAKNKKGYVWGVTNNSGKQEWTNNIELNVSTATWAEKLNPNVLYTSTITWATNAMNLHDSYVLKNSNFSQNIYSNIMISSGNIKNKKAYNQRYEIKVDSASWADVAGSVASGGIADNSITTAKIADNAITTAKITDANITPAKLTQSNYTNKYLIKVDSASWADVAGSVASGGIADNSITTAKIANNTVTTVKIADNAVTTAKLATDVVAPKATSIGTNGTAGQVWTMTSGSAQGWQTLTLSSDNIVANSITTAKIVDNAVTTAKLATDVVAPKATSIGTNGTEGQVWTMTSGSAQGWQSLPTIPTITDTYSETSTDGMSGVAVASAISTKADASILKTVATSGSYNDLDDKPTIPNYSAGDGINISGNTISAKVDNTSIVINGSGEIALPPGGDLAEIYKSTENLVPGDVVSIDTTKDDSIVKTRVAEDTLVAGVIATEPGLLLNRNEKGYKLALVGKVPTKVCNEGGNIKRGDLLVSASIAGYAKKAGDNPKAGTVIGKALENFDSQKGTILVLVNLQ